MKVYFDNAATTPLDKEVISVMIDVMQNNFGNPSAVHSFGRESRALIENSRRTIAKLLNVTPAEIFFTSGGTEADNMAIKCGIIDNGIKHAITSKIEHKAVLYSLKELEKKGFIKLSFVDTDKKGNVDLGHLELLLNQNERSFVSLMQANNEIATLTSIEQVSKICKKYNALFMSDTVQTIGHYVHDLKNIDIDFITCSAHKFHGPKGIGFIYINKNVKINPMIVGGSQERNMRAGTENVAAIVGLAKAMEIACKDINNHKDHIQQIKSYMIEQLMLHIPDVLFNGNIEPDNSLYTVLSISLPEIVMSDMLLLNMDIKGVAVSGGSACASGANIGSHVLNALYGNSTNPTIRFSFSRYNTMQEVDYAVSKLKEVLYSKKSN